MPSTLHRLDFPVCDHAQSTSAAKVPSLFSCSWSNLAECNGAVYKVEKTSHILKDGTLLLMLDLAGSAQGLARQINCLAVHPSRPHLCVTGASSGTLAVWDLRMMSAPAVQSAARPGAGEVLEVSHHSRHGYIRRT